MLAKGSTPPVLSARQKANREIIIAEAKRQGVPVRVALTFAWLESKFNEKAAGDLDWAKNKPDKYKEFVLDNPNLRAHPLRNKKEVWHSYGLFQLLAPHVIKGTEDQASLYDARKNAQIGVGKLKALLKTHDGDVNKVRLAFAGALKLGMPVQKDIITRLGDAYAQFKEYA